MDSAASLSISQPLTWDNTDEFGLIRILAMRMRVILIGFICLLVLSLWMAGVAFANPDKAVQAFISAIQEGNEQKLSQAMDKSRWAYLTDNGKNGFLSYSSSEPQLAFLSGLSFKIQPITKRKPQKWDMCLIPLTCTESAFHEYRLSFTSPHTRPYFLPRQLAFGGYYRLEIEKLESFIKNPAQDYREGFTLRLRQSIRPNAIQDPPRHSMYGLLPKARNLVPVVLPTGEEVPIEKLETLLPRLKSIVLQVQITRKGQFAPWEITLFDFKEAVIVSQGKEYVLPLMSNFSN